MTATSAASAYRKFSNGASLAALPGTQRWQLHRAGIVNVWYYFDQRFDASDGRLVLRGANGSGKSRALEMLLPFLLDADRRRMDATGSGKVRLEDLMRAGGEEQVNRLGYLWVELTRTPGPGEPGENEREYLTLGAQVRFSRSTSEAKVWYFTSPLRVDHDLVLMDEGRTPLSREGLISAIGAERITDKPEAHRDQVRSQVFGLTGEAGRQRYAGLLQLLHTLRSPDVGNRIDEGRLPQILSDALPPLSEHALTAAGEELDGLEETRAALERLESAYGHVADFLKVYSRYATGVLTHSANAARIAARTALEAERREHEQTREHEALTEKHAEAAAGLEEVEQYAKELAATATGIKDSREYRQARELSERLGKLDALAAAAEGVLEMASVTRREETGAVTACDLAAEEICTAAESADAVLGRAHFHLQQTGLSHRLPEKVSATVRAAAAVAEPVRTQRAADPVAVSRPLPMLLLPAPGLLDEEAAELHQAATEAATAGSARQDQARARHQDAVELHASFVRVQRAEERAEESAQDAVELEEAAVAAAEHRDTCAIHLATSWRTWVTCAASTEHLPGTRWEDSAAGALLLDVHTLAGEPYESAGADLEELDTVPHTAAFTARTRHATALASLASEETRDLATQALLESEAAQLRQARDVQPPRAAWAEAVPRDGIPLWRAVDFQPDVSQADQAGLEAALLASGLLTAYITPTGKVVTGTGQLLLAADGPATVRSVRSVLTAVPDSGVPVGRVQAALDRIALDTPGCPTWVHRDGSFGLGALRGRHSLPAARYIGAKARAAARAERLDQIGRELEILRDASEARSQARDTVHRAQAALDTHLRSAPRSGELATLRQQAAAARNTAAAKQRQAAELGRTADQVRRTWAAAERTHRERCSAFRLPCTAEELGEVRDAAGQAVTDCRQLAQAGAAVSARVAAWQRAMDAVVAQRGQREAAEAKAAGQWTAWSSEAAELSALQESMGTSAEDLRKRLSEVEHALLHAEAERAKGSRTVTDLAGQVGKAEVRAESAQLAAVEAREQLARAAADLARCAAHPALALATTGQPARYARAATDPPGVKAAAQAVLASLSKPDAHADVTALLRAHSALERNVMGSYDVSITVDGDIHVVELSDAEGRRHIAEAAQDLADRRDRGREALTSRERTAFQHFVLGGVAEELRTRIGQAVQLVKDMNASLLSISTSHGIGVKLRWQLTEPAESPVGRIRNLIALDGRVMRPDQSEELIALLKARVDERFASDPQAGYAAHLRDALDYRMWHSMDAFITGPGANQVRRISRRAKISQGETRFVSYVTLFAAADAYLSGLPDTNRALRLVLLDDAFAKVDNRTVGELMALLVRLDLDFVMTGHALWGFFPQVPALDAYEVRRSEGTAAVTTHVHWDGHTRHLKFAP
ncbi:TIGR02680 family protein [Streptomyces sp. NPDC087420]|uniref:TIGR02680 family protein n=1 Tax=Streptomyces sp. NPDC087420 TaxID=3365785 RepID=UPI003835C9E1